jgi:hypothetical protein
MRAHRRRSMQEKFMSYSSAPPGQHAFSRLAPMLAALACVLFGAAAMAQQLPVLKRGMWQFDRNVNGREMGVINQCANPTADMMEQDAMLTAAGCNF